MAQVGGIYTNFALWAIAIVPAWLVVRHFRDDSSQSVADQGLVHSATEAKQSSTPSSVSVGH